MMCGEEGFGSNGTVPIFSVKSSVNSNSYVYILVETIILEAPHIISSGYLFQQDKAAIHLPFSSRS